MAYSLSFTLSLFLSVSCWGREALVYEGGGRHLSPAQPRRGLTSLAEGCEIGIELLSIRAARRQEPRRRSR
jgi:hypothetical protein